MDVDKTKIELFRIIDAMPASMIENLYKNLTENISFVSEPMVEWQKKDIEKGIDDLNEGRKMDFDDFIASL